jgi:hypothetical protein
VEVIEGVTVSRDEVTSRVPVAIFTLVDLLRPSQVAVIVANPGTKPGSRVAVASPWESVVTVFTVDVWKIPNVVERVMTWFGAGSPKELCAVTEIVEDIVDPVAMRVGDALISSRRGITNTAWNGIVCPYGLISVPLTNSP